jgi:hypothetical protein
VNKHHRNVPSVLLLAVAAALLIAAATSCSKDPGSAGHRRVVAPAGQRNGVLRFDLVAPPGAPIRTAYLRHGRDHRPLSRVRVRVAARRGRLYVRVPSTWRATWWRTAIVMEYSSRAGETSSHPSESTSLLFEGSSLQGDSSSPPSETAGGSDVSCGFGDFRAGAWPDGCWRPYGPTSPFNQPLPSTPRLADDSAQIVARLLSFGRLDHLVAGEADTPNDFGHPTFYSQPGDPVFRLHCYETAWGRCDIEDEEIRIPDAARPASGGDSHLTVVDQQSGWEYDLYKVRSKPPGGGTLEFRWGGRTRIDGDGLGSDATAARFGNLAGIIRASELDAGHIDHALFMVARCDAGRWVYPAQKGGRSCDVLGLSTTDAPPMGTRLQLAMSSEQINALQVPSWKKTILRAMATYGAIFGDTGGGGWGVQAESGTTYTSFGAPDPLVTFAQANGWTPYDGRYIANLRSGIDWARYLRVIDPCVSRGTC